MSFVSPETSLPRRNPVCSDDDVDTCDGTIDACDVCGGDGSSCSTVVDVPVLVNEKIYAQQDMRLIEAIPLSLLALFILLLGVWPKPLIDTMKATIISTTNIITG